MDSGCFHVLAIINNTIINMKVLILFEIVILFLYYKYPEVELLDIMVVIF